ncbi:MAG: hypothetical protein ACLFPE_06405 [Bacteroidales bacterium]
MMKTIILKYSLILPLLMFFMWVGLTLFGCISCFFGADETFYCTRYCLIAKISIAAILLGYVAAFTKSLYTHYKS